MDAALFSQLAALVWIDLLLSGDNAVVIALVCRGLPANQQRAGMVLGTVGAIALRVIMALFASALLDVMGLRILGGCFLLWVAVKLLLDEADDGSRGRQPATLLGATAAIALADAGMSLDNVIAVAAIARGHAGLMAFGIALSIPFVIAGAALIKAAVDRFPIIVWAGAGLLAWVAGAIAAEDPLVRLAELDEVYTARLLPALTLALVLLAGWVERQRGKGLG